MQAGIIKCSGALAKAESTEKGKVTELFYLINVARNGTEGPDLSMMNGLWTHYQSVMAAAEKNTAQPNGNNVSTGSRRNEKMERTIM